MTRKYTKLAPLALCISAAPALAQQPDTDRIEQLEQQILSLQQQVTSSARDRVQFNGFFSAGYATSNNDAGPGNHAAHVPRRRGLGYRT